MLTEPETDKPLEDIWLDLKFHNSTVGCPVLLTFDTTLPYPAWTWIFMPTERIAEHENVETVLILFIFDKNHHLRFITDGEKRFKQLQTELMNSANVFVFLSLGITDRPLAFLGEPRRPAAVAGWRWGRGGQRRSPCWRGNPAPPPAPRAAVCSAAPPGPWQRCPPASRPTARTAPSCSVTPCKVLVWRVKRPTCSAGGRRCSCRWEGRCRSRWWPGSPAGWRSIRPSRVAGMSRTWCSRSGGAPGTARAPGPRPRRSCCQLKINIELQGNQY